MLSQSHLDNETKNNQDKHVFRNGNITNHILGFFSPEEHAGFARINKCTQAFMTAQSEHYQKKLQRLCDAKPQLPHDNEQKTASISQTSDDAKTAPLTKLPIIRYPLSVFIETLSHNARSTPLEYINYLRANNDKENLLFITTCIDLYNKYCHMDNRYHLLLIYVFVCGYDLNYRDQQSNTGLYYLLNDCYSFLNVKLIKFILNHPQTNKETLKQGLMVAVKHLPLDDFRNLKQTRMIQDILETKKIDLTAEDRFSLQKTLLLKYGTNTHSFKNVVKLFQQYQLNLVYSLEDLIKPHGRYYPDHVVLNCQYLLEEKLADLSDANQIVYNIIETLGHSPNLVEELIKLIKQHSPQFQFPPDLFDKIVKHHGQSEIRDNNRRFLDQRETFTRVLYLFSFFKTQIPFHGFNKRLENLAKCPLTKLYLKAQRIWQELKDNASDYKYEIKFFSLKFGFGYSKTEKITAIKALIGEIESISVFDCKINLSSLIQRFPVLATPELECIIVNLRLDDDILVDNKKPTRAPRA